MALEPRTALVYDAHDYDPVSKSQDPHGHGDDCDCSPRCQCGSGKDAFIHHEEAAKGGAVVVVSAVDTAVGVERSSAG